MYCTRGDNNFDIFGFLWKQSSVGDVENDRFDEWTLGSKETQRQIFDGDGHLSTKHFTAVDYVRSLVSIMPPTQLNTNFIQSQIFDGYENKDNIFYILDGEEMKRKVRSLMPLIEKRRKKIPDDGEVASNMLATGLEK